MNTLPGSWLPALLIFAAVGVATVALAMLVEWMAERRRRKNLTGQLTNLVVESLDSMSPGAGDLFRATRLPDGGWLQTLTGRVPSIRDLDNLLEQAHLPWSVQSYLLLSGGFAASSGLGILLLTWSGLQALIAAAVAGFLPYLYVRRRRTKRFNAFQDQLSGAVELLGRALRAGHPLSSGLKMVAEEMPEPTAEEFRRVFEEQRFGMPFEDCLTGLGDRMPLVDVRIFVTAVLVQREVGGNLTEILDNLAGIIRQRATLQRQVQTLTAEGRMGGYVLGALPIVVGIAFFFLNPEYMKVLFTHPTGRMMVAVALSMQFIGFLWMRKITTVEF